MLRIFILIMLLGAPQLLYAVSSCQASFWFDPHPTNTTDGVCKRCKDWGDYTSDGGTGGIETCYTTCNDGARVYWPHTCQENLCAVGTYMENGVCTPCPDKYYCPGDNTRARCEPTINPDFPAPVSVYTLLGGSSYSRLYGRGPDDCYCHWRRECEDGSCKTFDSYTPCYTGPGDDFRINSPSQCNNGFYATEKAGVHFHRCAPCNNAPENAIYTSYGAPDEYGTMAVSDCPWKCNSPYGRTATNTCVQTCTHGITALRTDNAWTALFSEKHTTPAIHIQTNNGVCYADLVPGNASGAFHVQFNGATYHTVVQEQ